MYGALAGLLAAEIAGFVLGWWFANKAGENRRLSVKPYLLSAWTLTGLFILSTADVFVASLRLGGQAGGYVGAVTLSKTLLIVPAAAVSVLYPRIVKSGVGDRTKLLSKSLGLIWLAAGVAAGVLWAAKAVIVSGTGSGWRRKSF